MLIFSKIRLNPMFVLRFLYYAKFLEDPILLLSEQLVIVRVLNPSENSEYY